MSNSFNPQQWSNAITRAWADNMAMNNILKGQAQPVLTLSMMHSITIRTLKESLRSIPKPYADRLWDAFEGLSVRPQPATFAEQLVISFGDAYISFVVDSTAAGDHVEAFCGLMETALRPNNLFDIYVTVKTNGNNPRRQSQIQNQKATQQVRSVQPHAGAEWHGRTLARLRGLLQRLVSWYRS